MSTREPTARPKSLMYMGNMLLDQLQSGQKRVEIHCNKEHPEETALKQLQRNDNVVEVKLKRHIRIKGVQVTRS